MENLPQKYESPKEWEEHVKQTKLFNAWCKEKGYFTHSKYFEAWLAALKYNKETT